MRDSGSLLVGVRAFRPHSVSQYSVGGRKMRDCVICRACAQSSQSCLAVNAFIWEAAPRCWALHKPRAQCCVYAVILSCLDCSLPGRVEKLTMIPFTDKVSCCVNFSAVPCQILPLSMLTSCGHLPPRYCGRVSQNSLSCNDYLFSSCQNSSVSINRLPSRWHLAIAL
jgi:hypothetical protein